MSSSTQPHQGNNGEQAQAAPELMVNKPVKTKQTRRRTHTSRPYQERLLNMAEARREIVTALRIHRANMRRQQQSEFQQQQQQPVHQVMMFQEQSQGFQGVSYHPNSLSNSATSHLLTGNYYSPSPSVLSCGLAPVEEEEASSAAAIGGGGQLELLPAHPLGLNLSFQGFGGSLDHAEISDDRFGVNNSVQPSPCPASAYSPPVTAVAGHGSLALRATGKGMYSSSSDAPAASGQMLDGDGETLSETAANVAAASAWWTMILESMESGGAGAAAPEAQTTEADDGLVVEAAGWPEWQWWLCDGVEQHGAAAGPVVRVDDGCCCYDEGGRGDHSAGIALPCVDDVAEIEGWGSRDRQQDQGVLR